MLEFVAEFDSMLLGLGMGSEGREGTGIEEMVKIQDCGKQADACLSLTVYIMEYARLNLDQAPPGTLVVRRSHE